MNLNPMGELDNARRFAEMISLMGPPPLEFLRRSKESSQYWDENGMSEKFPFAFVTKAYPISIFRFYTVTLRV